MGEPAVTDEIEEVRIEADEKVATEKVTDLDDIRPVVVASEFALTDESEEKNVTEEPKDAEDTLAVRGVSESEEAVGNAEILIEEKFLAKEKTEDTNLSVESSSESIGENDFVITLSGKKKKKKEKAAVAR